MELDLVHTEYVRLLAVDNDLSRFDFHERLNQILEDAKTEFANIANADAANDMSAFSVGKLTVTPATHGCTWRGREVNLTSTQMRLVNGLAKRPGFVKTRDQLMDWCHQTLTYVNDRTIDSHVKRIRNKFKAVDPTFAAIETIYGLRYRWNLEHDEIGLGT